MKKILGIILLCSTSLFGQEPVENVSPLDWRTFQTTQEEIEKKQGMILDRLTGMDERIRQLNINILSWQTAKQDIVQAIGDNRGCDFWKTSEDQNIQWAIMGFAVLGVLLGINSFMNLFKKKETNTK